MGSRSGLRVKILDMWERSLLHRILETDLDKKEPFVKVFQFVFPWILWAVCAAVTVTILSTQKGWDVGKVLLDGWIFYTIPPLGKEIIIPQAVAKGVPPLYIGFATSMVDICFCLFLIWNYDWVKKVPVLGKSLKRTEEKGRDRVKRSKWFSKAAFLMVTLFVFVPLQGSGGVGGTIIGRIVGLHPYMVLLSIFLGSLVDSFGYAYFASALKGVFERSVVFKFIEEINIFQIVLFVLTVGLLIYVIKNPRRATEQSHVIINKALDITEKGIKVFSGAGRKATTVTFLGARETLTALDEVGRKIGNLNLVIVTKPFEIVGPGGRKLAIDSRELVRKKLSVLHDATGKALDEGLRIGEEVSQEGIQAAGEIGQEGLQGVKVGVDHMKDAILVTTDRLPKFKHKGPPGGSPPSS